MTMEIADAGARYLALREQLAAICREADRDPAGLTLVAVSKNATVEDAIKVVLAGAMDLGENRVQEMLSKQQGFSAAGIAQPHWHLIGTLQTRKARQIVGKTTLVHSLDRVELAIELGKRSEALGIKTDVLMQFNIAREPSKHGYDAREADFALEQCVATPGLAVRGIMVMAPLAGGTDVARETFEAARTLYDRLRSGGVADPAVFNHLSMGMSGDVAEAIRAGATIVRVGSAIFGSPSHS